jgi:hypothetical protein
VAQIVSREQPQAAVSVAELLRRCASAPEPTHHDGDDAEPIPVGALLRREGRRTNGLPQVPDLPRAAAEPPAPVPAGPGLLVRRGALAAGALLAAGSAFVLTNALHATGPQSAATGSYPGEGALDGVAVANPTTPLDSGTAAPTSWMPVAFPSALTPSVAKHALAEPALKAATAAATAVARAGTAGTSTSRATTAATTGAGSHATGAVAQTTQALGDTVGSVGQNTPLGGVTKTVGNTVTGVGTALNDTTAPVVNDVVVPVVSAATPVVTGTTSAVGKVAPSTTGAVTKTVGGVTGGLTKLLG